MAFDVRGKTAVITGAADGIGAALALALAARGCNLALADLNEEGLAATAANARKAGVRVSEHRLDVADADAVAALPAAVAEAHGGADLLVNNAGVALMGQFAQVSLADIEWLFGINFWGVVRMTKAFMPLLEQVPQAHIVNISSIFGIIAPAGQTAYAASKFAVRGFTEALRHELEGSRIGVTVVHPGGIRTRIAERARRAAAISEGDQAVAVAKFAQLTPTTPEGAAARILKGIERQEKRVLIGSDAVQIDRMQRLLPVGHWSLLKKRMSVE